MDYKSLVLEISSILIVNFIFTRTEGFKLVSGTYRVRGNQAVSVPVSTLFLLFDSFFPDKFHLPECRFICLAFDF